MELNRDDLALARWFCGCPLDPGEDEIFDQITSSKKSDNIRLIQWTESEELQEHILNLMLDELPEIKDLKDYNGFNKSLGAFKNENGYNTYSPKGC